ncbi:MAG: TonB-dependent receptor domain-containing protein [Flavobacteriales bacterium]
MKKTLSILLILITTLSFSQTIITGNIIDTEFNDVLPFANIILKKNSDDSFIQGLISDFDGKFRFDVINGEYSLEISFVGYETKKITGIQITDVKEYVVDIYLSPLANSLEEVIVTTSQRKNSEVAVLLIQKKSINLIDGLSSQSIKRTGDTNLASAIKRVPGVSVQDGKFVYVRGLGDRYSKTLLGGLEIPGLDPDKNTLQLDVFPTNILDNIIINKSASADLNADFSGGIVNIILKDFSNLPQYSFSVSGSYNPEMNFVNQAIRNNQNGVNFLGFNNGYFDRPIGAQQVIPLPEQNALGNSGVLNKITSLFEQQMAVNRYRSGGDFSVGATASNQFRMKNETTIGYIAAFGFRSDTDYFEDYQTGTIAKETSGIENNTSQRGELGVIKKLASALIGISFKTKNSKYKLNLLNLRSAESNAIFAQYADYLENPYTGVANILTYTERNIVSIPFSAKHILREGKSIIEWKVAPSFAEVFDKDFKKTVFETDSNLSYFTISPSTTQLPQRLWRTLKEDAIASKILYTHKIEEGKIKGKIKTGVAFSSKNRSFRTSNYAIDFIGRSDELLGNPDNLLDPSNLWTAQNNRGSHVIGSYQRTNQYDAESKNIAGFLSAELKLSKKWKSTLGIRFENYSMTYTGETIDQIVYDNSKLIDVKDFFPSINIINSLNEQTNLRLSYSRTTARPSFKENSSAQVFDPITERYFIGNPELKPSYINNLDLRFEKYGEGNQFYALSGFYKNFNDPIEIVALGLNSPNQLIGRNNTRATVVGLELEYRKNVLETDTKKFSININTSLIYSQQKMSDSEYQGRVLTEPNRLISKNRELQGQSPFILNAGLTYSKINKNIEYGLFYNVQGKTLEVVGVGNIPDVYTDPFNNLDIVITKKLGETQNQTITFKIQNILGDYKESYYDYYGEEQRLFSLFKVGRSISLGYSMKF